MDWLRDHLWETWLGVAIVLGVAEMFSLDLFLVMLAAGALGGMATAFVTDAFWVQALVAAAVSVGMLAFVRPSLAKRFHGGPELTLGADRLIGQRAVVTQEITGLGPGRVRLAGEIWSAAGHETDEPIAPGQAVEVVEIRGATAYVRPVAPPELEQ
ncbi:NfeD family protein [Nocardioides sp. TF02-7]|uniref:NfeD family protein n=1 Tax=Nocardioides sp. TF02-7 TaxID=2917724 RepID=UPI001F055FC9|nr:NfeD family protein [Nocardioides sp. TF02-7]UMG92449.1 NfeD family protein [Nocardioides sp. TF02-7]